MRIKFDSHLDYQDDAIASVVELFKGQESAQSMFSVSAGAVDAEGADDIVQMHDRNADERNMFIFGARLRPSEKFGLLRDIRDQRQPLAALPGKSFLQDLQGILREGPHLYHANIERLKLAIESCPHINRTFLSRNPPSLGQKDWRISFQYHHTL